MKIIAGLSGFGDSIYLEPLARKEIENSEPGEEIAISTNYPEVFGHLFVKKVPYSRSHENCKKFSYLPGKTNTKTNQLEDMGYHSADEFQLQHAPIALLACGYPSMGTQSDLIPEKKVVEQIISDLKRKNYQVIHISNGSVEKYAGVSCSIVSSSYFQTVAMFKGSDLIVCQQGWGTALAEGLNKRCFVVFSNNFRINHNPFIAQITPDKVCCKPTTCFLWDNEYKGLPDEIE